MLDESRRVVRHVDLFDVAFSAHERPFRKAYGDKFAVYPREGGMVEYSGACFARISRYGWSSRRQRRGLPRAARMSTAFTSTRKGMKPLWRAAALPVRTHRAEPRAKRRRAAAVGAAGPAAHGSTRAPEGKP